MGKFVTAIVGVVEIAVGLIVPGMQFLIATGVATLIGGLASALMTPGTPKQGPAAASGTQVQVGEVPRQGVFGEAAIGGSLVDAFNYGGTYGTDWTVLVIALADHKCESLEGFYVNNDFVAFAGDGTVSGYNSQLQVFFRNGSWSQSVPSILTTNAPLYPVGHPLAGTKTWTSADVGRGVAYVVVAYKADDPKATNPVWTAGRPTFIWKLKGLKVYSARDDTTVGGSGAHRWSDDTTRVWSDNLADCRYTWVRGIYADTHVDDPKYLLLGRGLSADEAPPENVFAPANLCDETVSLAAGGSEKRYRIGGLFGGDDAYIDTENDFAAACGGMIVDRAGSVELVPGEAQTAVFSITDADLVEQTTVTKRDYRSKTDSAWVNMVSAVYVEPTQKWATHAAPLRRVDADVAADGEPRVGQPQLKLVTSGTQAQRVAEMMRRKGRLWLTRSAVLPPRLAGVEHGDWITWTSNRYGPPGSPGTAVTYLVTSDGQGQDWRNSVSLAQISSTVFDWTTADELAENGQAVDNPAISPIATTIYTTMGALYLRTKTVNYPLSSDDTSISIAAFDGVTNIGETISFPADTTSLTSLTSGTVYGVFWDTANSAYVASAQPATSAMANPIYVFLGWQETSTSGTYSGGDTPPPGFCVADSTPVLLANGTEAPASSLAIGTVLRTRHEKTLAWDDYPVAAISFVDNEPVYACALEGAHGAVTIRATADHLFLIENRWVRAAEIGTPDGTARVAKITVEEAHTYVSDGVLSHNLKAT